MASVMAKATSRLVDRLAEAMAPRISRRGFIARSAIVGSALAVAPRDFLLRPMTAYAAICGCSGSSCDCGATCCDGYTEFCCTLTGFNACPSGTGIGGWWKADGSNFCGGASRYYMDCNVLPGANPCSCGCAGGSCDNRKVCCTRFRYGQCHQEIAQMGAIMCRVVTCTPPWQLDGTCTTTEAIDQGTLDHDRPCLHPPVGALDSISLALGNVRVVGWAADPETPEQPIYVHVYLDDGYVTAAVADKSRPDVASALPGFGPAHGFDVTVPVAGASKVCVYAINRGVPTANPLLGCKSVLAFGNFESARPRPGGIRVSGWAIDAATSESTSVQVYVDGASAGSFVANGDRPDVAAAYKEYGAAHGFVVDLPMAEGPHHVCINALDRSDARRQANIGCRAVVVGGNPFGNLETVQPRPGGVRLQGWAIDPDTNQPVDIHVYVDQQFAGAFTASLDRPDVGAVFPDYGSAHGFLADVSFGPASHNVCAYAINRASGTSNPVLGCRAVSSLPFGNFDSVAALPTGFRLQGWAIDPDTAEPVNVHVYIDGAFSGVFTANTDRPDVGAAYPQYGAAHGFSVDVATAPGTHQICVYAIDRPGPGVNPALGCRSATR